MSIAFLPAHDLGEKSIQLQLNEANGKTLIECSRADVVAYYLTGRKSYNKGLRHMSVKGIYDPNGDCVFELFDGFGRVTKEGLAFRREVVKARLLEAIIWKIQPT